MAGIEPHIPPVQRRSSSFFLPMLLLPKRKRQAMQALYYFCRAADDAVDEASNEQQARQQLRFWQHEIHQIYTNLHGELRHTISRQLAQAIAHCDMPKSPFDELLRGFQHDCARPARLSTLSDLDDYCYCVAGCVGILAMRIFGITSAQGDQFAMQLGEALQLTNITRDIAEDARHQRCYIPQNWLADSGLESASLEELSHAGERLDPLRKRLLQKAGKAFKKADELAHQLSSRQILPALIMRDIYFHYYKQLQHSGQTTPLRYADWWRLLRRAIHYYRNQTLDC